MGKDNVEAILRNKRQEIDLQRFDDKRPLVGKSAAEFERRAAPVENRNACLMSIRRAGHQRQESGISGTGDENVAAAARDQIGEDAFQVRLSIASTAGRPGQSEI